jgi:hypothetical protein
MTDVVIVAKMMLERLVRHDAPAWTAKQVLKLCEVRDAAQDFLLSRLYNVSKDKARL